MKATKRLIDSVWTVEYNVLNDFQIEIVSYSREDKEGYEKEGSLPQCSVIEDSKRNFVGLLVKDVPTPYRLDWVNLQNADHEYTVVNQKHVFSYNS